MTAMTDILAEPGRAVVPCFTPGTEIATADGLRPIEDLLPGDGVITRDNGLQPVRWIGRRHVSGNDLLRFARLRPILIQRGALGSATPRRDVLVSPRHRILIKGSMAQLHFGEPEVLVAARFLTGLAGIDEIMMLGVTYLHFMFDRHEVVEANGLWSESFQPGIASIGALPASQRRTLLQAFPDLAHADGLAGYFSARHTLSRYEAAVLTQ